MAKNNWTLKELSAPDLNQQPLCIEYPQLEVGFELKSGMIHLLPTFHGFAGEDPNKHLKEFHMVCSSIKPTEILKSKWSRKPSHFLWLIVLKNGSITCHPVRLPHGMRWRSFSWRNFPASKVANIRKGIYGIRQMNGESIYEFWERVKKLCASCPYHHISKQLLIWYFYEGLMPMEQSMIDAANRRALVDKTP